MKTTLAAAAFIAICSVSAHAAQPVITETDSAIIVEYTGITDEKPAAPPRGDVPPGGAAVSVAGGSAGAMPEGISLVKKRDELRKEREARRAARHPDHEAE